jgi:uncharacterized protein
MKYSNYNTWIDRPDCAYVYNTASGGLLRLDKDSIGHIAAFVERRADHGLTNGLLAELIRGRFLVQDGHDELAELQDKYERGRQDAHNLHMTIVPSLGCNFDCPYCFELKEPSTLNRTVADAIVKFVESRAGALGLLSVEWFGGEPLLGHKALFSLSRRLLDLCDARGVDYRASIVTNGYLLDRAMAVKLKAHRVAQAQVSIDGPPDLHDRMRPLKDGGGTFHRLLDNVASVAEIIALTIRINVGRDNVDHTESVLRWLRDRGLTGKVGVYIGHLTDNDDVASPSSTYGSRCLTKREFAAAEMDFIRLAADYGFGEQPLPRQKAAPCTAIRVNDLVIGSRGELYKCYEHVGARAEVIGHIQDFESPGSAAAKWLQYSPFQAPECRACRALPVCMGGCPHHAFERRLYEDRCGAFRFNHRQRIERIVARHEAAAPAPDPALAAPN